MISDLWGTVNVLDNGYKVLRKKYLDLEILFLAKMDLMCLFKSKRNLFLE